MTLVIPYSQRRNYTTTHDYYKIALFPSLRSNNTYDKIMTRGKHEFPSPAIRIALSSLRLAPTLRASEPLGKSCDYYNAHTIVSGFRKGIIHTYSNTDFVGFHMN